MQDFTLERKDTLIGPSGDRYPLDTFLGQGSFGRVIASGTDKIVKILKSHSPSIKQAMLEEITLQTKVHEKEPTVCPKIYAYGYIPTTREYIIVMERYDGTARDLLESDPDPELRLAYYEQVATLLQRLEPYQFNHRDLKSDNVMYRKDPATGKVTFVLIDFGFSCATIDGKRYAGTQYFTPKEKCFRRSRDLAALVFESLYLLTGDLQTFANLVLTFQHKGKVCNMAKGCPPLFPVAKWSLTYDFLNRSDVENPNTTPEGLLKAIESYRQGGLQSCRAGFVVHPVANQCVAIPPAPAPAALHPGVSPKPHALNPSVKPSATRRRSPPCPPGKVRNPKTKRCVKAKAPATKSCPPGKVRNPKTGRCIKQKP